MKIYFTKFDNLCFTIPESQIINIFLIDKSCDWLIEIIHSAHPSSLWVIINTSHDRQKDH